MRYKNLIWTDHILQRMKQRQLSYDYIYWVFQKPDKQEAGKKEGSYKFFRKLEKEWLVVVGKKNEHGEWVLLTCWSKPLFTPKKKRFKSKTWWEVVKEMLFG